MKRKPLLALMCSVAMLSNPFTMWASTISGTMSLEYLSGASDSDNKYTSGQYKVGSDIPSGEYILFASGGPGYFCISSDANGDDIITNENFDYNTIITISDGQYFELQRCYALPFDEVKELDLTGEGMFKAGVHIPAGEYKLNSDSSGMGYYCIYDSSTQANIVSNNNFDGSQYVIVQNGQYLQLVRCSFDSVPEMVYEDTETVKMVQEKLNEKGYDCGTPDGIAGANTKNAISKFESDNNLPIDGIITSRLLEALEGTLNNKSESNTNIGVDINNFVERYNEGIDNYNLIAESDNYNKAEHITVEMVAQTGKFNPDGQLELCVNPNTTYRDTVGIINMLSDDGSSLDQNVSTGEMMAMIYAFDTSFNDVGQALELVGELAKNGEVERNGIKYNNFSFGGLVLIIGKYDGFNIEEY